ncbi:MAG: glutamyl-tRNA reductase [Candidatus Methylarchaceae archaeon HK02M2]|nr:glutamyl-tRNA reductase [Candidatus Methylarchaceae archaeon HK02M2]
MDKLNELNFNILNIGVNHKNADIPLIEAVAFRDKRNALNDICDRIDNIVECLILQTCNRVEIYSVFNNDERVVDALVEYLLERSGNNAEKVSKSIEIFFNQDVLRHIFRIASGLESMMIGEDQILGQVWDSYLEAETNGTAGPVLKMIFHKAVSIGQRVRQETNVNKGAVSIGSAAVRFAEETLGGLDGKNILVVGAGDIGTLVAKALVRQEIDAVFVANRTYERALRLAKELNGEAIHFDQLKEAISEADVVICATNAPHYILTTDKVKESMRRRKKTQDLLIVDVSNPRNVDEGVKSIEHIKLYNIDGLRLIAKRNLENRRKEVSKVEEIIEKMLPLIERNLETLYAEKIISLILSRAEKVRKKELKKALGMLRYSNDEEKQIVDSLTCVLIKRILVPIMEKLRPMIVNNNQQSVKKIFELFNLRCPSCSSLGNWYCEKCTHYYCKDHFDLHLEDQVALRALAEIQEECM